MENAIQELTDATGSRLDFYNIGGLAIQRTRESLWGLWSNYSWRELLVRGGIVSTTLLMGILSANTCDHDQCSSSLRGLVGGSIGFFAAHTVAIIPTIQRRNTIIRETQEFKAKIDEYVNQLDTIYSIGTIEFDKMLPTLKQIRELNDNILNASLPVTKKGDAVNNLITKKILMRNLCDYIAQLSSSLANNKSGGRHEILDQAVSFWKQDINDLRDQFRTQQFIEENNTSSIGLTQ